MYFTVKNQTNNFIRKKFGPKILSKKKSDQKFYPKKIGPKILTEKKLDQMVQSKLFKSSDQMDFGPKETDPSVILWCTQVHSGTLWYFY